MTDEAARKSTPSKPKHKKLAQLPPNARVHKRPLLHPAITSPYAGAQQQKVIYISTKTPFLSAVKRAEKLLHLADRRLVQSATTVVQQKRGKRKDELLEVAETVERERKNRRLEGERRGEEVVLKGTGKAIQKVTELALWFQQREEYAVRLRTASVGAIDDVEIDETESDATEANADAGAEDNGEEMDVDAEEGVLHKEEDIVRKKSHKRKKSTARDEETISGARIRYTSVLEVIVSLR